RRADGGGKRGPPVPATRLDCSLLGRAGPALHPPAPDGHQPQELVDRPATPRLRAILHGDLALVHASQRGVPNDAAAARRRRAGDALPLLQEHGATESPLRRRAVPAVPAPLPVGAALS